MKKIIWLAIFLQTQIALADYPYNTLDSSYKDTPESKTEVSSISPIKAQDGIGLCYGFSATTLLENYRCREFKLDCQSSENLMSSLDVTSYLQKKSIHLNQIEKRMITH